MQFKGIVFCTVLDYQRHLPMNRIITFFATGCFAGKIPIAPGTWGTAVGLLLYWLIRPLDVSLYIVTAAAFVLFAVWISDQAAKMYGEADPQEVVIDEIAGYLVTMTLHTTTLSMAFIGFILFRAMDITKPWPARRCEKLRGGWGIVMDDLMAGIYANGALWIFERWLV